MSETNKRKEAVALSYDEEESSAPKVVAKGKGDIATNIIEKAHSHQVPIQEDPTLVKLLGELDINETIPEELYQAVAEVFAYVYQLDKQLKAK
ncbi:MULTISPECIES: EscU/YscU/HrcU family type III secretion system export apparatus switch protein [Pontibacillus]|uniref:EscU/YscU/HrcU family type III secretion system export apparatus switch protein n=1 Tax=Pontibacillus chungwhensis TaxID=265426 RepID=A0ABY8V4K4_9BACI|nr:MULTISPECIES: EscU/YscU/HrcU family type III secretion system export apparatus switch protein [Pontibacillus]MCD5322668.1 EscU/YscU/HrcU family type III secretion system export apparatus switch protein [Pontibacillus sp. HN14]WIF99946.1 EscU/YscU/HrcU family type III secretion system export apparatus switch protein [Pontibacillus chungwhensis]